MHETYLVSFHGMDIGKIYNLPRNVRVYMYCYPDKAITANFENEARTWEIATSQNIDREGKFMTKLKIYDDDLDKKVPYCVFSGNLKENDLNRVPDLYFEDEEGDFKTGLYHLPCKFKRVFIKNHFSSVDKKSYNPGDIEELNSSILNKKLKELANSKGEATGFLKYFLEPSSLNRKKYSDLSFVVVPDSTTYESYSDLLKKTPRSQIKNTKLRKPDETYDISVPNTQVPSEIKTVMRIQKEIKGFYLSDLIRYLCNKHPTAYITIVISACRCFYTLPKTVRTNQMKTTQVSALEYYKKYSKLDT